MNKLKNIIAKNLNGKKIVFLFLLTSLIYVCMLFITIPKVTLHSRGIKLLDMMPTGYNLDYIHNLFETLGDRGRFAYLYSQIPLDMIYPLFFGVSYCLILAYFLNKLNKLESSLFYLCLLPLIAGIFDYFENIGIILMLTNYPNYSLITAKSTNIFTIIKSLTTSFYFIILIIVLILTVRKNLTRKKTGLYKT